MRPLEDSSLAPDFKGTLRGTRNPNGSFNITLQITHLKETHTRTWRDVELNPTPSDWNLREWIPLLVAKLTAAITSAVA